jgi:hypothetical protein
MRASTSVQPPTITSTTIAKTANARAKSARNAAAIDVAQKTIPSSACQPLKSTPMNTTLVSAAPVAKSGFTTIPPMLWASSSTPSTRHVLCVTDQARTRRS